MQTPTETAADIIRQAIAAAAAAGVAYKAAAPADRETATLVRARRDRAEVEIGLRSRMRALSKTFCASVASLSAAEQDELNDKFEGLSEEFRVALGAAMFSVSLGDLAG